MTTRVRSREGYLLRTYGITEADYERILEDQGGVCALCGKKPSPRRRLAVDHDHTIKRLYGTIVVNGLIHSRCNTAFGKFEWSDEVLHRTIKYAQAILARREEYAKEAQV
jgi:hypothetical protein